MRDVETFSGDPDNPVKVSGIEHIYKKLPPGTEFKTLLLEIFPETGEAEVLVEADESFWALYDHVFANASPKKILQITGESALDIPKEKKIKVSLQFNSGLQAE